MTGQRTERCDPPGGRCPERGTGKGAADPGEGVWGCGASRPEEDAGGGNGRRAGKEKGGRGMRLDVGGVRKAVSDGICASGGRSSRTEGQGGGCRPGGGSVRKGMRVYRHRFMNGPHMRRMNAVYSHAGGIEMAVLSMKKF